MRKKNVALTVCIMSFTLLFGCDKNITTKESVKEVTEKVEQTEVTTEKSEKTEEKERTEKTEEKEELKTAGETSTGKETMDLYIGEYNDYDNNEPNLEIAEGENGQYIVQIGIFRLTTLDDGIGTMTDEGIEFTATDASGSPIGGVISLDGDKATVTFTDSTWEYIKNGDQYCYTKSSDTPNLWENSY